MEPTDVAGGGGVTGVVGVVGGGTEADHEALRTLKAVFEKAVKDNDLEPLREHLDEQFTIVTFTNRQFKDFDTFKAQWQKTRTQMLKGGEYSVHLLPERSTVMGDLALAKGDSDNIMRTGSGGGGAQFVFNSRWTVLLRKTEGKWKILRAHSSLSPFDNPMLRAAVKKRIVLAGAAALIVGAAVGAGVVWLLK